MSDPKPASRLVTAHHCGHLRHKGMYVLSAPDPDEFTFYDPYEATAYWCACTQSGFGPDRVAASGHGCQHGSGRMCCDEPSHDASHD
jgi:hypothetical protein